MATLIVKNLVAKDEFYLSFSLVIIIEAVLKEKSLTASFFYISLNNKF
jgi:hypothetical protein